MRSMLLPLLVALPMGGAMGADPTQVTETVDIAAPAAQVWGAIKDFNGLNTWHPAVAEAAITEGENNTVGAVRKLTLGDGGVIMETLTAHDEATMSYSYDMGETVLPVAGYQSTITVSGDDASATVTWSGQFEPTADDSAGVISTVYRAGLDNLKTQMEGS